MLHHPPSTEDQATFMRAALVEADKAAAIGEVPVGALVVRDGVILARAHNLRETDQDPCAHAELMAIRSAAAATGTWRLDGAWVFVTLEPCAMCAGAMVLARVAGCVFGCTDPKGGFLGTLGNLAAWPGLNHRFEVVGGVLEAEAALRLSAFFRALRATKS